MTFVFREELVPLLPYPPGKPIEEVKREFGLETVVKLASNENPCGPSPNAVDALRNESWELHRYPESGCYYLREELASRLGLPADYFIFGAGSDEIVALLALAYLRRGDSIVTSEHAFIRYEMGATMMGAATRKVPRKDWRADVDGLLRAVDVTTRFVFVANPDNPVGTANTADEVARLLAGLPPDVILVLDEAYHEYASGWAGYPDSVALVKKHPNLIVTRTFSKAYGLAGLRVGYAYANPEIWDPVDRVRPPFNVGRGSQAAALAALSDANHLNESRAVNSEGYERLTGALKSLGIPFVPSIANFILAEFGENSKEIFDGLLRKGVVVRPVGIYDLPRHLRISIGLRTENSDFISALEAVLAATPVAR